MFGKIIESVRSEVAEGKGWADQLDKWSRGAKGRATAKRRASKLLRKQAKIELHKAKEPGYEPNIDKNRIKGYAS